jgi:TonB-linked SusC/RagA family outer membrane protein
MYKNYTYKSFLSFFWQQKRKLIHVAALLSIFLLLTSVTGAQTVTISYKNAPLKTVLKELRKQSHYSFFIAEDLLRSTQPVTINIANATLKVTLEQLFKDGELTYSIDNNSVTIFEKVKRIPVSPKPKAAFTTALGIISNEDHEPLEGATVRVKNKNLSTVTMRGGVFSLQGIEEGDILQISFLGFSPTEVPVNNTYVQIVLKRATSELDEVQVLFNGKTSLRSSTGSQITITHEQLAVSPAPNIIEALVGLVPGLTITQNGPNASSNFAITLRGTNALPPQGYNTEIAYINQPLILLDGFPLAQFPLGSAGEYSQFTTSQSNNSNGLSVLFSLNPADIENVTVLKDADATAIYGTRGANGVILITTRRAKGGDVVASASLQYGVTTYAQKLNLMNTQQYLAMRNQAYKNDGDKPTTSDGPDLTNWSQTRYTNWQKMLLGDKPTYTANFAVAGGKGTTTFIANGGYFTANDGVKGVPNSQLSGYSETRTSLALSTQSISTNGRLQLDSHFDISVGNSNLPSGSLENLIFLAPNAPALYDAHGNINFAEWTNLGSQYPSIAASVLLPNITKNTATNTNIRLSYLILKGLNVHFQAGYSTSVINAFNEEGSLATTNPSQVAEYEEFGISSLLRSSDFNYGTISSFTLEPNFDYSSKIGKGLLTALAGVSYNDNAFNTESFSTSGYVNDYFEKSLTAAGSISPSVSSDQQKLASVYARLNYNYDSRYVLTLSGRRDGSSTFGPERQWGTFGSIGGAWVFSDEKFTKAFKGDVFSFGKIRASYGITGSPVTNSFGYLSTYTAGGNNNYEGSTTFAITQAANPDIKWAQTKKLDIGTDLGFLNDQLVLTADVYRTITTNMLLDTYLGSITGLGDQIINLPAVIENKGLEININYRSEPTHKITWFVGANIAMNRNDLVAFPNLQNSVFASQYTVGQSISRQRVDNLPLLNPQTGVYDYQLKYLPGDYTYVDLEPKFTGGIQQGISYQGFSLSLDYTYALLTGFNGYNNGSLPGAYQDGLGNELVSVGTESWQNPGDKTIYPKLSNEFSSTFFLNSQRLETQVFYIALKNARLSYSLQKNWTKKLGISSLSFNISATNLFYITNYKGVNPESPTASIGVNSLMRRELVAGLNASF